MAEQENLARSNFEGYRSRRSGVNHDGTKMPSYEGLTDGVREGWAAGAAAVEAIVLARLKSEGWLSPDELDARTTPTQPEAGKLTADDVDVDRDASTKKLAGDDLSTGEVIAAAERQALEQREDAEPESTR